MKLSILIFSILTAFCVKAQEMRLVKNSFDTYRNGPGVISADSALRIVNVIYNLPEFKDSLLNLSFSEESNCECSPDVIVAQEHISGTSIYNHLFKAQNQKIDIVIRRHDHSALGRTTPCDYRIFSYFENIISDMKELSFAQGLSVNLCHEYFHSLGYCHDENHSINEDFQREDGEWIDPYAYRHDATYRIGWIVFDILNRRVNKDKRKYPYGG